MAALAPSSGETELRQRLSGSSDDGDTTSVGATTPRAAQSAESMTFSDKTGQNEMNGRGQGEKAEDKVNAGAGAKDPKEEQQPRTVYGKTADGVVFPIPETHDMLSSLFEPRLHKSHLDLLTLALLGLQVLAFFCLPYSTSRYLFLGYFAIWRLAYNLGLGYVLTRQSLERWIVMAVKREGWMDGKRKPAVKEWIKRQLAAKMGKDYDFEALPLDYNVWLFFRHVVDIILLNDFLSYFFFAVSWTRLPEGHSMIMNVLRWTAGVILILFNLWVKVDAHRIVKDFAWYWGDAFFLSLQELVFDGVFELAPHPMYSVGYAGYYGLSLITGSQTVLFVSLAAHACQFAFLVWFENPHIDRTYGQKKPLAARIPLPPRATGSKHRRTASSSSGLALASPSPSSSPSPTTAGLTSSPLASSPATSKKPTSADLPDLPNPLARSNRPLTNGTDHLLDLENLSTPSVTEGETETDTETETEAEWEEARPLKRANGAAGSERARADSVTSVTTSDSSSGPATRPVSMSIPGKSGYGYGGGESRPLTRHDLDNRYFRNDVLVFKNLDPFRAFDFTFLLLLFYGAGYFALPHSLPPKTWLSVLVANALFWRLFHTVGLGLALRAQSKSKWIVRHFVKHYHYEQAGGAIEEAFRNWKQVYNLSLCMTYVSFGTLAWRCYTTPEKWTEGIQLTRHVMGVLLVALHIWTAQSTYETLGPFGWFYGDFFIQEYPTQLYYTGIYRFLNNPERSMGGAAFFGLAVVSGSKVVGAFALLSILAHWWFLSHVENPHMKRLYGAAIRKDAGVTKTLKNVAQKNMHHLPFLTGANGQPASARQRELQRVAREVHGTFGKVLEETVDAVEEFLERSGPRLSDYVEGTKILLQQSRERLLIRRVASDLSPYDVKQYQLEIAPSTVYQPFTSSAGKTIPRYHLGEALNITWRAPSNHSRKDWIGIYRLGANKSRFITRVASLGLWLPLHGIWDGDTFMGEKPESAKDGKKENLETGNIKFDANKLPWKKGMYELRYHHDGKHNVMARVAQFEVAVEKPADPDSYDSIHATLLRIVPHCLNHDRDLIPLSALPPSMEPSAIDSSSDATSPVVNGEALNGHRSDPDDFVLYDKAQAERVSYAIEQAFGVEFSTEVVIADANIGRLANRVLEGRRLLRPFGDEDGAQSEEESNSKADERIGNQASTGQKSKDE